MGGRDPADHKTDSMTRAVSVALEQATLVSALNGRITTYMNQSPSELTNTTENTMRMDLKMRNGQWGCSDHVAKELGRALDKSTNR